MRRRGGSSWFGNPEQATSEWRDLANFMVTTGPLTMHQAAAWLGGPKGQAMAELNKMTQRQWMERIDWAATRSPGVHSTSIQRLVMTGPGALMALRRNPTGRLDGWRVCTGVVTGQLVVRLRGAQWCASCEDPRKGLIGKIGVGGGRDAWVIVLRKTGVGTGRANIDRIVQNARKCVPSSARVWAIVPDEADLSLVDELTKGADLGDRVLATTDARLWDRVRPVSRMFLARTAEGWKPIRLSALEKWDAPVGTVPATGEA